MKPNESPIRPADQPRPVAEPAEPATRQTGFRRTALTAGMAAALLIASGVPIVSAASPDAPASSATPDQADR